MEEKNWHEELQKKVDKMTGGKDNILSRMLESMDGTNEREVLFRLDQLLNGKLADLAKDRSTLAKALLGITIPSDVWRSAGFHTDKTNFDINEGLEFLVGTIYDEVLIHKILELPLSPNWEVLAGHRICKNGELADKETIIKFWRGVKKYGVPIKNAIAALEHTGIDIENSGVFDLKNSE